MMIPINSAQLKSLVTEPPNASSIASTRMTVNEVFRERSNVCVTLRFIRCSNVSPRPRLRRFSRSRS